MDRNSYLIKYADLNCMSKLTPTHGERLAAAGLPVGEYDGILNPSTTAPMRSQTIMP